MAPIYKLTYFNGKGGAECARYLLKYGKIDFEDIRISKEEWPKLKNDVTFGQLPILEYQNEKINQTAAINRYLAHVVKLAGKNQWEDAQIDARADTSVDLMMKLRPIFHESDESKKNKLLDEARKDTIPFYFERYEAIVLQNNGFLCLGRLTWADFQFACYRYVMEINFGKNVYDPYPNLKALIQKVESLPSIKQWIEVGPITDF